MFTNLNIVEILSAVLVYTFSLSVHEYAHARMAYQLGDRTAYSLGRMTINPARHIDPLGLVAFIFAHIGWARPVPFNPNNFRKNINRRTGTLLVALAGPVSNLVISFVSYFLLSVLKLFILLGGNVLTNSASNTISLTLLNVLQFFFVWNIWIAVFNMMPIPPLDGYKVFGALLPARVYYRIERYEQQIYMIMLMLIIFGRGILGRILYIFVSPLAKVITFPIDLLFSLFS